MTMPEVVATCLLEGVPESAPVDVLKLAQVGLFTILNFSVSVSASVADGVKE
jgi:hypothetical protein